MNLDSIFTYNKLDEKIKFAEASVYKYFENKYLLVLFLVNWYWVTYLINFNSININDYRNKLRIIIHSFVSASKDNASLVYVNNSKFYNNAISEGGKTYHNKNLDHENSKVFLVVIKN